MMAALREIGLRGVQDSKQRVGRISGMGYKLDRVVGGSGYSYTEYLHKVLGNGQVVHLRISHPSPLAPDDVEVVESYSVPVYWEPSEGPEPQDALPSQATWDSWAPDGDCTWFANFGGNQELAEAYASTLPVVGHDDPLPPPPRGN